MAETTRHGLTFDPKGNQFMTFLYIFTLPIATEHDKMLLSFGKLCTFPKLLDWAHFELAVTGKQGQ